MMRLPTPALFWGHLLMVLVLVGGLSACASQPTPPSSLRVVHYGWHATRIKTIYVGPLPSLPTTVIGGVIAPSAGLTPAGLPEK
jgi:hypothetical protein